MGSASIGPHVAWGGALDRWGWTDITKRLGHLDWAVAYLCLALSVGVLLVFITPPFQNFDEAAHFYRSWSVAEGHVTAPGDGYVTMPESAAKLEYAFPIVPIATNQVRVRWSDIASQLKARTGGGPTQSTSFSSGYGPLGYLPQAAAVTLLRPFGRSPLAAMYLGRLFNLLCSVALVFFAIRLLPFAKALLFLIALLPMVIMQMASMSPDALLISGSFFFAALVLHCAQLEKLTTREMIALPAAAVLLLNTKPGYVELALLVLVLVPSQFANLRRYLVVVGSTIIGAVLLAGLLQSIAPTSREVLDLMLGSGNGVDAAGQLSQVLHHPFAFLAVVKNTLDVHGIFYAKLAVAAFAWGNLDATDTVAFIAAAALAAVLAARESARLVWWRRGVFVGVAVLSGLVVCLGLYISFTPVAAATIDGLQGRYFVPSAAVAFLGLAGFPYGRRWVMPLTVLALVAVLLLSTLRTILLYYY
jgi:hypothetical protein